MANVSLDKETFFRRMKRLYTAWKNGEAGTDDSFGKMDCLVSAVGTNEDIVYSKSTALQTWLLAYELTNTIMILAEESVTFLTSKNKTKFLRKVENQKSEDTGVPPVKLLVRDRNDEDKASFGKLVDTIKGSKRGKTLGVFSKENYPGAFMDAWRAVLKIESFDTIDVSAAAAYVMCPKDDAEILTTKKACLVSLDVFTKYLKDQIIEIINSDKKVKHSELAEGVHAAITNKKYVSCVDVTQVDMCYPAIIQSGGNYSLKFSAVSDENSLHFGVIVCSFGARYKYYCSNIVRTLLINPTKAIEDNYNFLLMLEDELLKKLVAGTRISDVYEAGIKYVKAEKPTMLDHLTKNFGFAMGIEFRESSLRLGPKTHAVAKKGMVFNVHVGLSNLANPETIDKEEETYALFVGDTVLVNEGQPAIVLTPSKKKVKNIGIYLTDESGKENEPKPEILGPDKRTAVIESKLTQPDATFVKEVNKPFMAEMDFRFPNSGTTPTCVTAAESSVVDLTWVSPGLSACLRNWKDTGGKDFESLSDDRYIYFLLSPSRNAGDLPDIMRIERRGLGPKWSKDSFDPCKFQAALLARDWDSPLLHATAPGTIDIRANELVMATTEACEFAAARVKDSRAKRFWWNPHLTELRRVCIASRRALIKMRRKKQRDEEGMTALKEARRNLRAEIRRARALAWEELFRDVLLDDSLPGGESGDSPGLCPGPPAMEHRIQSCIEGENTA